MEIKKYKLTDICDFQGGSQPPKKEWSKSKKEGYVRMLQIRDFTQSHKDNVEYVKVSKSLKTCKSDDVLIGRYGASVGKILTGLEGAYNVAIMKTIPHEKVLSKKYLLALLKAPLFQNFILSVGVRAAQAGFNKNDLSKFHVYLPSLDNQKRIAKVLSDCENLIQIRNESIVLLDEFLKSTFLEMFGANPNNPKKWETKKLKDVVAPGRIVTYGIVQAGPEIEDGVPYIRTGDIKNGKILVDQLRKTSFEIAGKYKRSEVNKGDIIMSIRATVGTAALLPDELDGANLTQGTARISPGKDIDKNYLLSYVESPQTQRWINKQVKGATFKEITLTKLREMPVWIPPKPIQLKFKLIAVNSQIIKERLEKSLGEIENLYGSLSQKAFKGELDLSKVDISQNEETLKPATISQELKNKTTLEPITREKLEQIIKSRFGYQEFSVSQIEEILSKQGIDYTTSLVKGFIKDLLAEEKIRTEYSGSTHQVIFKYNQ
jgi:type I restriction enzyme S subunit